MADIFAYENGSITLPFLLLMATSGIVAACIVMLYQIKVPGKIVRILLSRGALDKESAADAAAIGHKNEGFLRFLFSENGALRKYIIVEHTERDEKGRGVYLTASYYLKRETKDSAELRYRHKNATVGALIAAIIIFPIVALILCYIIPDLIKMLENFIASLKGGV